MPNLLASILSVTSGTAPASYADVPDLSAVVSVASTNSIILLIATVPVVLSGQKSADFQFAHDGVREGPEMTLVYSDNVDEGVHGTMVYALTGISGSHTLSVQWQDRVGAPTVNTGRVRGLTIIELLDGEANLLVNVFSTSSGAAPASFADIPSFTGTPTVASTDSILLFIANVMLLKTDGFQKTADMQFAVGGVREGPELTWCWDDSTADGASIGAGCMTHVKTGISGAQTLSAQWQRRTGVPDLDTGRTRTFQVLELLSADLLVSVITSAAGAGAPATFADVPALSGVGVVDGIGSVVLMGGNVPIDSDATDRTADFQFADGGVREGPEMTAVFNDGVDDQACSGMLWAKDGISGSHTFSLQWQDRKATPALDTGRNRSFYVIDLKAAAIPVTSDAVVAYASQIGVRKDEGVSEEALQGILKNDVWSLETVGTLIIDLSPNVETLISVVKDEGVSEEAGQGILKDQAPNVESLIGVLKDDVWILETVGTLIIDLSPNVEARGLVTQNLSPNFESLITVVQLASNVQLSTFLIIPIILALALPLDEQSGQPGDVEQLDLTLSLDEE